MLGLYLTRVLGARTQRELTECTGYTPLEGVDSDPLAFFLPPAPPAPTNLQNVSVASRFAMCVLGFRV